MDADDLQPSGEAHEGVLVNEGKAFSRTLDTGISQGTEAGASRKGTAPSHDQADHDSNTGDDDTSTTGSGLQQEPDPFYDEAADDEDAVWAERQRCGRTSDAVLSCPGCFTTLCMDCQRHEKFHQQYRAMFVMNCQVQDEEGGAGGFDPGRAAGTCGGGSGAEGRGGRRPKRAKPSAQYRRVCCVVCGTEVGAYEVDEELYHFYHVFPSNA